MITAAVNAVLREMRGGRPWWQTRQLAACFGSGARAVGYAAGPQARKPTFAFLAVDAAGARRSAVWFASAAEALLITFDLGAAPPPFTGGAVAGWTARVTTPPVQAAASEGGHLRVIQFSTAAAAPVVPRWLSHVDLAGAQAGHRVALFHTGKQMARDAVHFDSTGSEPMECLVTGLAPGGWEVWRNGYLEDPGRTVQPSEGCLYLNSEPGGYFLRPLG